MTDKINRRGALKMIGGAAASLPVARFAITTQRPAPRNAPNFIFIMTDDQRQDAMSAYGNRALIIVSASEAKIGTADFHGCYGFSRIIRVDPPHP